MLAGISQAKPQPVSVLSVRSDLFYFKVNKAFRGATVEVYASSGQLVYAGQVTRHRMLIDFFDRQEGDYTIRIKKDSVEVDYRYSKVGPAGVDEFIPPVTTL
jgi:hypothetical protein